MLRAARSRSRLKNLDDSAASSPGTRGPIPGGSVGVDLLAWAERFVATSSVSHEGNKAIAACAAELLQQIGLEVQLESVTIQGTQHRVVISDLGLPPAPGAAAGLLLVTHLDTVPAGDARAWTATGGDPLRPTREGDHLYGLGAADAKVDFVCKAAALVGLDRRKLLRRVRIVGTFGEEIGLLGTKWLVSSGKTEGFRYALVGEPSELVAIHAHKGYAVFEARVPLESLSVLPRGRLERVTFEGMAAHSSTPRLGRNAIDAALERLAGPDVVGFAELEGGGPVNKVPERSSLALLVKDDSERGGSTRAGPVFSTKPLLDFHKAWHRLLARLQEHRDPEFDPDHSVGSLGHVQIRDACAVFKFDLRPIPGMDPERAVEPLAERAEIECLRRNPALATPLESPLVQAVGLAQEAVGLERRIATKATCTEAGLLAQAGLDAVVLGAGASVGNVHRPNEHTRIPELFLARDLYREVIHRLCVEPSPQDGEPCTS